jgi:predicted nucleic acid-binding Zn ribbon protein
MSDLSSFLEVVPETARALLGASQQATRQCPAPGCGRPLTSRQRACSGRCRAALSRQRREEARAADIHEVRAILEAALRRLDDADGMTPTA